MKPPAESVAKASARGGVPTLVAQAVQVGTHLAGIVILARLLTPDDYGTVAMVYTITAFAGLFRDLGLSAAAIQRGTLSPAQMTNLFWLNVGMGLLLAVLLCASAPAIAWFFKRDELVPLSMLLSLNFVLASLGTQHNAMLQRSLRYGRRATALIAGSVATLLVSTTLATLGYGYWALAWGTLAGSAASSLLLFVLSPFRPGWWQHNAELRPLLRFGANVTGFEAVNYFARNFDNLIVGRVLGSEALGLYNRAYQLLMFPITNLRNPITVVAYPALSRLQSSPAEFRHYFLKTTQLIGLLTMPVTALLFVVAEPLVAVALGERWLPITPVFRLLAFAAFIQPAVGFVGSLLLSLGRSGRYLRTGLMTTTVYCVAFTLGVAHGTEGVALAYSIANYILLFPYLCWALKDTPVSVRDFLGACLLPASLAVAGGVVATIVLIAWPQPTPLGELAAGTLTFAATVLGGMGSLPAGRTWISHAIDLVRQRSRPRSEPQAA